MASVTLTGPKTYRYGGVEYVQGKTVPATGAIAEYLRGTGMFDVKYEELPTTPASGSRIKIVRAADKETPAPEPAPEIGPELELVVEEPGPNATEGAMALAEDAGLDLSTVAGTGENGRVTKADVQKALEVTAKAAGPKTDDPTTSDAVTV